MIVIKQSLSSRRWNIPGKKQDQTKNKFSMENFQLMDEFLLQNFHMYFLLSPVTLGNFVTKSSAHLCLTSKIKIWT